MARINSNIPSLIARANLNRANDDLQVRLQRLSTGLQINRGADNPAGLIISERLRSEIRGIEQAVDNSTRASAVIATTEGSLAEVSDLLNSIKSLVVEASNTGAISDEERQANQLQIDSAIDSITRISNSASFGGLKLLNGELAYTLSGLDVNAIAKAEIYGANFAGQQNIQVQARVLNSAQTGSLYMRGDYASVPSANGTLLSSVTLAIAGKHGVQELSFVSGTSLADVVAAVNTFKEATGVSAALINAGDASSGVVFSSTSFGDKSFVSVEKIGSAGDFFETYKLPDEAARPAAFSFTDVDGGTLTVSASKRDHGRDVVALINGVLSDGEGLTVNVNNSTTMSLKFQLAENFATTNGATTTFHVTGGGALFQLGGEVNTSQQTNIALPSIAASRLGGTLIGDGLEYLSSLKTGGANDLSSGNFQNASQILETAIDEISVLRGRLGAFERNTLDTNVRSLESALENLTASESLIRDADFAAETSSLTRAQVLNQASTSVLALANQQSQSVLQLLG